MTLRETVYFWVGTNANLYFVAVGVIALEAGLSVWEALVAVVLGTLLSRRSGWPRSAACGRACRR